MFFRFWPCVVTAILAACILVFAFDNMSSPQRAGRGPDEMLQISLHLTMMNSVKSGLGDLAAPLAYSMRKPHLPYLASVLFTSIVPAGYASLLAANYLFLFLWLTMVFLIAKKFAGAAAGAATACAAAALPMTWRLGEHFGNDMPVAFFTLLILLIFLDRELFTGFWMWPLAGLVCGVGMLAKPTLPLYVAGAAAYVAGVSIHQAVVAQKRSALALTLAGILGFPLVAAAVWLPWFAHPVTAILELFGKIGADANQNVNGFFHTINGKTAVEEIIFQLKPLAALGVTGGLVAAAFQIRNVKARILVFAFIPPVIVFSIVTQAFTRMIFPVLAVPLVLGCAMIAKLSNRFMRHAALIIVSVVFLFSFAAGHRHMKPRLWPARNFDAPAYVAQPVAAYIASRTQPESDLLFINRCVFLGMPKYYFAMLMMQDVANLQMTHLWDPTGLYPGVDFHMALPRRFSHVKWILECRMDSAIDEAQIGESIKKALRDADRLNRSTADSALKSMPLPHLAKQFPAAFEVEKENYFLNLYRLSD